MLKAIGYRAGEAILETQVGSDNLDTMIMLLQVMRSGVLDEVKISNDHGRSITSHMVGVLLILHKAALEGTMSITLEQFSPMDMDTIRLVGLHNLLMEKGT